MTLVILAAGMGSRYGGMKQIDPVDEDGHIIIDFSIYDAYQAGFEEVIFIIKKENEKKIDVVFLLDTVFLLFKIDLFRDLHKVLHGPDVPDLLSKFVNIHHGLAPFKVCSFSFTRLFYQTEHER